MATHRISVFQRPVTNTVLMFKSKNIRIFNDEVRIENSVTRACLASQGLPSDAEYLSQVTEFSIPTEQPLQILFFFAYSSFDSCIWA